MSESNLSPDGEVLERSFEILRAHLETHKCLECLRKYETVLSAITNWLTKGESHDEKETEGQAQAAPPPNGETAQSKGKKIFGDF